MIDLSIRPYEHRQDFPEMWKLFCDYNQEVCSRDYNHLVTAVFEDGSKYAISRVEQWVMGLDFQIKVIKSTISDTYLGFIIYGPYETNVDYLWIEGLYIVPEMRYNGVSRALFASFPTCKGAAFALHKSRSHEGNPMMQGMRNAHLVSAHPTNDLLTIWHVDWPIQSHPQMDSIRSKHAHR